MKKILEKYILRFQAILFLVLFAVLLIPNVRVSAAETKTVELVAVGDDLIHTSVYRACKTRKGYNFDPLFKHIKKDIRAADISVINQETILVDKNYSGYPSPKPGSMSLPMRLIIPLTKAPGQSPAHLSTGTGNIPI